MKSLLPFLLFANIILVTECKFPLSILGFIPLESGASAIHLTNLSVNKINAREDILPDFNLKVLWVDSGCRGNLSLLFDNVFTHSPYIPDENDQRPVVNGFPSSINVVIAQLKFISDHSWTRVATINYDSLLFSHLGYELQRGLYRLNITNSVHSISSTLY